jgi:hypothetical protein
MIGNALAGLYGSGVAPSTTAYESIATVTVGSGGQASAEFTSISSSYKHLQIRVLARSNSTGDANDDCSLQYNSDTGSNYVSHALTGNGTAASAGYNAAASTNRLLKTAGPDAGANVFGGGVIDILDYANTNKYKTARGLGGMDTNGTGGVIALESMLWLNTNAITSIKIAPRYGTLWVQYSTFALYGIKGS